MLKALAFAAIAVTASAGWVSPAGAELTATRKVIAIIGGDLYVGTAVGNLSGAGTLALHSQVDPSITCRGEFTSTKELGGAGDLRCSDGATAAFKFTRVDVFHGHGTGTFSRGTMSFTYGMSPAQSLPYLALPAGKKLSTENETVALVDR
jgi:hypothetical protein